MNDIVRAPWTSEQVQALNTAQEHGTRPPRICGAEVHASGRSPLLDATHTGWICPDPACTYTSDWEWRDALAYAAGIRDAARTASGQQPETCRPIDVDGTTVLVRGSGDWTDEDQHHMAAIVAAAKRRYEAEHPAVGQPAEAQATDRCSSCEHGFDIHDVDGRCWFTVEQGVPERDLVCSCKLRRMAEEARS